MSTYTIDASHSHATFTVRHMMISNVRGEFSQLEGELSYDPAKPEASTVRVSIDAKSINTHEEKRDAHLRSADFLDVEKFPTLSFVSTGVTRTEDGLAVAGELTLHGVTKPVTLAVTELTEEHKDPWGNLRRGAQASAKLKRSDFGLVWNVGLELGGVLVGDEVKISLEVELLKKA